MQRPDLPDQPDLPPGFSPHPEPEVFDLLELAIDMRLSENELWKLAEEVAHRDLLELEVEERLKPVAALLRAVYLLGYGDGAEEGFRIHPKGEY